MKEKLLYLSYGSNINVEQMNRLCGDSAKIVGKSTLENYEIVFRGKEGNAFLNIEKKINGKVPILIWEINKEDEKSLDQFEEFPNLYKKEIITVNVNNKLEEVMVYVMTEKTPLGRPSDKYYNTVAEGYKTANFDIKILEESLKKSINNNLKSL